MRIWPLILILLAALPALAQQRGVTIEPNRAPAAQLKLGDAYALVIGNNQYRHLPVLQTAVSDAAAVAELLRGKYDFAEVELLLNASRADILTALARYRRDLEPEDRLLIYYAGHGMLDRQAEEGYWLPVDAAEDISVNWISNASITTMLKAMLARHVLIVADSCYSGALTRDADTAERPAPGTDRLTWLARVAAKRARTALVSGGLEPVVDGGRNGHSVFASAFLDVLRENRGLLDGQGLFDRLKGQVVVNADQTPAYGNVRHAYHEGGDFIFAPRAALAALSTPPPSQSLPVRPSPAANPCLLVWQGIADSDRRSDHEAFLKAFPDCPMAPIARARLAALKVEPQLAARTPPAEPAFTVEDRDETLVALKNANVRGAPETGAEKLTTLKAGSRVSVTGRVKGRDWLRVALSDGRTGYVWIKLLGERPAAAVAPPAKSEPKRNVHPDVLAARGDCYMLRQLSRTFRVPAEFLAEACDTENTRVAVAIDPSLLTPGSAFRDCDDCPIMVIVPAGSFTMGSPGDEPERGGSEGPQHRVTIPAAFAVGKYEVTRGEFKAFVAATGYVTAGGCFGRKDGKWSKQSDWSWRNPGYQQTDSDPVACMNYDDAKAYTAWLSHRTGQHYRLLSEAEWEYAARAGTTTPFSTGDQITPDEANFKSTVSYNASATARSRKATAPVGSYQANGFGLHDMHGNVWERVEDCRQSNYQGAPVDGRAWTAGDCEKRMLRGGGWDSKPSFLRSAKRSWVPSESRSHALGFRVARSLRR